MWDLWAWVSGASLRLHPLDSSLNVWAGLPGVKALGDFRLHFVLWPFVVGFHVGGGGWHATYIFGPFCLLPLSAWWPFVYFAVVVSPLYHVGFIFLSHLPCHLLKFFFFVSCSIFALEVSLTYLFICSIYPHYFYFIII